MCCPGIWHKSNICLPACPLKSPSFSYHLTLHFSLQRCQQRYILDLHFLIKHRAIVVCSFIFWQSQKGLQTLHWKETEKKEKQKLRFQSACGAHTGERLLQRVCLHLSKRGSWREFFFFVACFTIMSFSFVRSFFLLCSKAVNGEVIQPELQWIEPFHMDSSCRLSLKYSTTKGLSPLSPICESLPVSNLPTHSHYLALTLPPSPLNPLHHFCLALDFLYSSFSAHSCGNCGDCDGLCHGSSPRPQCLVPRFIIMNR